MVKTPAVCFLLYSARRNPSIRCCHFAIHALRNRLLFTLRSNSNGFCRCFACRIGKIPLPLRYLTEFSVLKIPTMNCNRNRTGLHCTQTGTDFANVPHAKVKRIFAIEAGDFLDLLTKSRLLFYCKTPKILPFLHTFFMVSLLDIFEKIA